MELRAKARQLKAEKDIDILFIDYIQLLHAPHRLESRQQEISYISRSLKALAKELEIPIIALSQLSRAVESRTDHRPIMSDLRESGAIEQDADVVMFIYRKYVYSNSEEDDYYGVDRWFDRKETRKSTRKKSPRKKPTRKKSTRTKSSRTKSTRKKSSIQKSNRKKSTRRKSLRKKSKSRRRR